ncbi:GTP 3',8-cyclase, mitochondrial [Irineochytrium annulatum]|nr:GTP 3',8-cyclase, mitochondrial [Irineochytrium annulatum]
MPANGVTLTPHADLLTAPEILRISKLFVSAGVNKIRLTGGEPTLRKDLLEIVGGLNDLRGSGLKSICMTTNGIALKRKLPPLVAAGLDTVNISLDTLDPMKFELMTRRKGLDPVLEVIDQALASQMKAVKVNAVVIRNINDMEVPNFIDYFTKERAASVRFIEYMPFSGNQWNDKRFIPYTELLKTISTMHQFQKIEDDPNDTTKVCLFGKPEVSLRDMLRSGATDAELLSLAHQAVMRKKKQHAGMIEISKQPTQPMILIGG